MTGGADGTPAGVTIDVALRVEDVVPATVEGRTVLVIDVLRASTTMVAALGNGCAAIVPVGEPDEALRRAAALGDGTLVGGERRGDPLPGFDLGNSPLEYTAERVARRPVIFTTSNGTRALLAARGAAAIGVAGFVNLSAAAAWAAGQGRDVAVLCAGELGRDALEDSACAGLLVDRLVARLPGATVTPAAAAASLARPYAADVGRLATDARHARRLVAAGRGGDVAACLTVDSSTVVPVYLPSVDKVVAAPR
ncbi:MAG: 2-phosphosulfolactate phosphatase [Candidatus Rokubacteria bacterium]|nr:2-phosphosulfolactate phosphatase [Candidatus Rokubacteria bacterium]